MRTFAQEIGRAYNFLQDAHAEWNQELITLPELWRRAEEYGLDKLSDFFRKAFDDLDYLSTLGPEDREYRDGKAALIRKDVEHELRTCRDYMGNVLGRCVYS